MIVFSLGIGRNVDRTQLNDIASSNNNVFTAASFAELEPVAKTIVQSSCPGGIFILFYFIIILPHRIDYK